MQNNLKTKDPYFLINQNEYAFNVIFKRKSDKMIVDVLGNRFLNSLNSILHPKHNHLDNPFEAFISFTRLVNSFGKRGQLELMPPLAHLVFWMEIFFFISYCLNAKVSYLLQLLMCRIVQSGRSWYLINNLF